MTTLIREGPISAERDFLIRKNAEFEAKLELLAREIGGGDSAYDRSPVYCISGAWGAGKSSAINVLEGKLLRLLGEDVGFARFRAPLHDAVGRSVRLGLLIELALSLPERKLADLAQAHQYDPPIVPDAMTIPSMRTHLYEAFSTLSASPIGFEALLAKELQDVLQSPGPGIESSKYRYVVFVEDVDRTGAQYTADLLTALTFWREVCGVVFIIACSREHLAEAGRLLPNGASDQQEPDPLPKHVHYTVDLPMLIDSDEKAAEFAKHLLDDNGLGSSVLRQLLDETSTVEQFFGPLVTRRSPRAVIEVLNRLLVEFGSESQAPDPGVIKRRVAKAVWPTEFAELVQEIPPDANSSALQVGQWSFFDASMSVARAALEIRGDFDVTLTAVAEGAHLDLQPWPVDLLYYLASYPPFDSPREFGTKNINPSDPRTDIGAQRSDDSRGTPELSVPDPLSGEFFFSAGDDDEGDSDELRRLYYLLDGSDDDALPAAAETFMSYVRANISELEARGRSVGATIGNAALRIGRVDRQQAYALHELAHRLNPEHANIRLNLAEFLLDNSRDEAPTKSALAHVEWCIEHASKHSPDRAAHLLFRSLARLDEDDERLPSLLPRVRAFASQQLIRTSELINALVKDLRWFDEANETARTSCEANPDQTFAILRSWADLLATEPAGSGEERLSADLYRWICASSGLAFDTLQRHPIRDPIPDTAHNFASILYTLDYDDAAGHIWRWIYETANRDTKIRRGYAQYLANFERDSDTAAKVIEGESIDVPMPSPSETAKTAASLPTYFSDQTDRWWEIFTGSEEALELQRSSFLQQYGTEPEGSPGSNDR